MSHDSERDPITGPYLDSYSSLANFIDSDRDHTASIFRRFGRLTARNLLYLQSELLELEAKQSALDEGDRRDGVLDFNLKPSARTWETLVQRAAEPGNTRDRERLELIVEIREKVKEYHEALQLDSSLLSLPRPSIQTYHAFYNGFWNKDSSNSKADHDSGFPALGGKATHGILSSPGRDDLISLGGGGAAAGNEDALTKFLRNHLAIFFLRRHQSHSNNNNTNPSPQLPRTGSSSSSSSSSLAYLSTRHLHLFVGTVNVLAAAILLFGAIYNLYYVRSDEKRLALIAAYTVLFALGMGLMTGARRAEIFGACAAYAAVLVVFVSGDLGAEKKEEGLLQELMKMMMMTTTTTGPPESRVPARVEWAYNHTGGGNMLTINIYFSSVLGVDT